MTTVSIKIVSFITAVR